VASTRLYGKATAQAWDRLHPRLTQRAAWIDHDGPLPIIEGTVIRLVVEKLPSGGVNKPVWLWWSGTAATTEDVNRCWQSFLRRFDLEHTFRLPKQTLGWTKPRLRNSEAADRWTWLVIAAYAQLRLARPRPQGVQKPAYEDRLSGWCTETVQARPRSTTRFEEPPPGDPPRRGTRPRHWRGIHPPCTPQEGRQTTAHDHLVDTAPTEDTEAMRIDETAKVTATRAGVALAAVIASPVLLVAGAHLRSRYVRWIFRDGAPAPVDKEHGQVSVHYLAVTSTIVEWLCAPSQSLASRVRRD
jgi:hypothetical protein